ncbi:MAG TPA: hypothetical protein PLA71_00520 [Saccharofermentans sp.]|nr:hypothetical protein [Saccharofermentans sp.]
MSDKAFTMYMIYSVCYQAIVWGLFGYAVFFLGHSGWWVLVALIASNNQLAFSNGWIQVDGEEADECDDGIFDEKL